MAGHGGTVAPGLDAGDIDAASVLEAQLEAEIAKAINAGETKVGAEGWGFRLGRYSFFGKGEECEVQSAMSDSIPKEKQ